MTQMAMLSGMLSCVYASRSGDVPLVQSAREALANREGPRQFGRERRESGTMQRLTP